MTHEEKKEEFEKLTTRAKRSGMLRAVYPDQGIAILLLPPPPPEDKVVSVPPSSTPPAASSP